MYALINSKGMYLQVGRDFSFTPDERHALKFSMKDDADRKATVLRRFGVKVVTV